MSKGTTRSHQKLLAGAEMPDEEERAVLQEIVQGDAASLPFLCRLLLNQRREWRRRVADAEAKLARLREPPWYPADVLDVYPDGRLDVVVAGRRQVVHVAPELSEVEMRSGDEVFLDQQAGVALARNERRRHTGLLATVVEKFGEDVVLRGPGDEDSVAIAPSHLAGALRGGDRVLYRRDTQRIVARFPQRNDLPYRLEEPPPITFADIGGLDAVIGEIRRDLELHLLRPEAVHRYRLELLRGVTLVGPPGTGKSMIAAAVANFLCLSGRPTRFLHVKPGELRGSHYGESERRIRELFAAARAAAGIVVIFFDEIDSFGARGVGIGQEIDGRVLGALLAEMDGLGAAANVLCIGATNRLDLCDEALLRERRFKDRLYHVPRPGRRAAREIFARYLTADLPYGEGDGAARAAEVADAAVAYLFAARGGAGVLATLTLADGTRREVAAAEVLSGALIAGAVERAKHAAADRDPEGLVGLTVEDVLSALDQALAAEADKVKAPHAAARILDFPRADTVIRVELPGNRRPPRHRYMRAA